MQPSLHAQITCLPHANSQVCILPVSLLQAKLDQIKAAKPKAKRAPAKPKAPAGPAWDASMRPPPLTDDAKACRILSWNVAGLRVRRRGGGRSRADAM